MKNLNVNVSKIKEMIDLKTEEWNYLTSTNCYAYALGLDIPFSKISNHAYQLGCFSEDALKRREIDIRSLNREQRLSYDLHYLGLSHVEVEPDYKITNLDTNYTYFLIAFFETYNDFHFLRKSNIDNTWYHKEGYISFPKNRDDDRKVIYNPKDAFFIHYSYVKTLKIGFKNKR